MSKLSKWLERKKIKTPKQARTPDGKFAPKDSPYPDEPELIKPVPAWKLMWLSFRLARSIKKGGDNVKKYSILITLWKGFWVYLAGLGVVGATEVTAIGLPETLDDLSTRWPALVMALVPALWKCLDNWRKNSNNPELGPRWTWPWE